MTINEIIPVLVAAVGTALFLAVIFYTARAVWRGFGREPSRPALAAAPKSNYNIFLTSLFWVMAVKLVIMILAQIITHGDDFFADAARLWQRSDAPHYISIAQNGYLAEGEEGLFIVFFPLFPLLLGLAARLTGEYFWTGSCISMLGLAVAGYYLYKLVREEYGENAAARAMRYFMLFPAVFFAWFPYSEGLFLALTAAALYYMRKKRYVIAAVISMLAALTRSVGVLLAVPMLYEIAQDCFAGRKWDKAHLKVFARRFWPVLIVPLGTAVYLAINYIVFGDMLHFMSVQKSHWGQAATVLPYTLFYLTKQALTVAPNISLPLWLPQLFTIFATMGVMLFTAKRGRQPAYLMIYAVVLFWMSISLTRLLSAPRYMLAMLPCFAAVAAGTKRRWQDLLVLGLLGLGLIMLACAFAAGYSIY